MHFFGDLERCLPSALLRDPARVQAEFFMATWGQNGLSDLARSVEPEAPLSIIVS